MGNLDYRELASLANQLLDQINGKDFFVTAVLERVREASNHYPHDGAIRTMQFVLEKRAASQGTLGIISQAEFGELYSDVASMGNREAFKDSLGDLLPQSEQSKIANYNDAFIAGIRNSGTDLELTGPDSVEDLDGLFGDRQLLAAKGSFVDNGRKGLEIELASMGFKNPDVEVAARNEDFVIYSAGINSTAGRVSTYIPAEMKLGSVLLPSVFVSGDQFVDLTKENLLAHAQEVAGGKRSAAPHAILSTLAKLTGKQSAVKKMAEAGDFDAAQIPLTVPELYASPVEQEPFFDVEQPKVAMPKELEHLTSGQVQEILVEAGLGYDRETVLAAKNVVATELKGFGVRCDKVSIASEFGGGLMVAANIVGIGGLKTIEVPVEIINGNTLAPSVFTAGALAQPFDKQTLLAFAADEGAGKFDPTKSSKYLMSFKDLHSLVLKNAAYGDFVEVEEGLAVIADQYGMEFHKVAHDDLIDLLTIGYADDQPAEQVDHYLKQARERAQDKENFIHVQSSAALLYPRD